MKKDFSIYERLAALSRSDAYPYHMPGHKRNPKAGLPAGFAELDITEIEYFDDLHHAEGILKDAMEGAAALYGADRTFFLVNGSTCGVLAAISSAVSCGDSLIMARNAHMSAYHGAYLRGCHILPLYPELLSACGVYGAVRAEETERLLKLHPEAKAVFITSPTYDGWISDVETLAAVVHAYGRLLIVDEAHGAHFGLDPRMPRSSVDCGADIVIHSLHKTLPSLTQTALLHVKGSRVDLERLERFLRIYQTSSPSYLLTGSIDCCIRQLKMHREEWFSFFWERRAKLITELSALRVLRIIPDEPAGKCEEEGVGGCCYDPSKLMIFCDRAGISGVELQRILLEEYHLQMEMAGEHYVLAILTVMDTREGYVRLAKALKAIDAACCERLHKNARIQEAGAAPNQELFSDAVESLRRQGERIPLAQAMDKSSTEEVELEYAEGRVVTEFAYAYPPGISVILPGERMTKQVLALLKSYRDAGLALRGPADETLRTIRCAKKGAE